MSSIGHCQALPALIEHYCVLLSTFGHYQALLAPTPDTPTEPLALPCSRLKFLSGFRGCFTLNHILFNEDVDFDFWKYELGPTNGLVDAKIYHNYSLDFMGGF